MAPLPESETGVYLLANDAVAPWLEACAASLRHFNPDHRVIVIAYDDALGTVSALCERYRFELWHDPALVRFDGVAAALGSALPVQRMRKLAAFWGPLNRFLYLDVDTVVLADLTPVLELIAAEPQTVVFAHCDRLGGNLDEVYLPGAWREAFVARHGSHAANSGVWGASREIFTPASLAELVDEARPVASQFPYPDQGFLNFCLDRIGTPVINLHDHVETQWVWAGAPGYRQANGGLLPSHGPPIGLVHWAGYQLTPKLPYRALWEYWAGSNVRA